MLPQKKVSNLNKQSVVVAKIARTHGLNGYVRIAYFVQNADDMLSCSLYWDENLENKITIIDHKFSANNLIVLIDNVQNVKSAYELCGKLVYANKAELFKTLDDGEFYVADLIGCSVKSEDGTILGIVIGVHNFGSNDILELDNKSMLPFLDQFLIKVNIEEKTIIYSDSILD